ncbi:uncharacterized protein LOC131669597 isoform X1 [Phymastichus coffea]|uniref:uncharacterized protein LOC131669597 isoform X1 n=1 Tax=Phymastichus coffea TaxID=108790 RepID=UPI00273B9DD9|nr:uncharacterized protein LOC131669597 isoform X1 [Phymastichus coffea]
MTVMVLTSNNSIFRIELNITPKIRKRRKLDFDLNIIPQSKKLPAISECTITNDSAVVHFDNTDNDSLPCQSPLSSQVQSSHKEIDILSHNLLQKKQNLKHRNTGIVKSNVCSNKKEDYQIISDLRSDDDDDKNVSVSSTDCLYFSKFGHKESFTNNDGVTSCCRYTENC